MRRINFINQAQKYQINLDSFNKHSKYFLGEKREEILIKDENIFLVEDFNSCPKLSDEIIINFIQYFDTQEIKLNNDSIFPLKYLSTKYEVDDLTEQIDEYINNNFIDLIDDFLPKIGKKKHEIQIRQPKSQLQEDLLLYHMSEYITDDRLPYLPIHILYRLISKYSIEKQDNEMKPNTNSKSPKKFCKKKKTGKNKNTIKKKNAANSTKEIQMINLFIECLKKQGITASVLLDVICIDEGIEYLIEKLDHEIDKFDIDINFIKTNLIRHLSKKNIEIKEQIQKNEEIHQNMKEEFEQQIDELKEEQNEKQKEMEADIYKIISNMEIEMKEKTEQMKNEMKEMKEEYNRKNEENEINQKASQEKLEENIIKYINETKIEINKKIDEITEDIKQIKEEYEEMKNSYENKINELQENNLIQNNDIKNEFDKQINETNEQMKSNYENKINELRKMIQKQNDETNKKTSEYFISLNILRNNNNNEINKLCELLTYFSKENEQSYQPIHIFDSIFIPNKSNNFLDFILKNNQNDNRITEIGIRSNVIEMLCSSNKYNTSEFIERLNKFSKVIVEFTNSSLNINQIFNEVSNLKKQSINVDLQYNFDEKGVIKLPEIIIPDSTNSLAIGCFSGCSALTKITIAKSITEISERAFEGCSKIVEIKIPSFVTKIGYKSFKGCSSLKEIEIPSNVTIIGSNSFQDCSSLSIVDISSSVQNIGSYAFSNCKSLTHIFIPNTVKDIGLNAFEKCSSLKLIAISPSISTEFVGINSSIDIVNNTNEYDCFYSFSYKLKHSDGFPANIKEVIKYYKIAINKGNSAAMNDYALTLEQGNNIQVNEEEAVKYYKMAIEKGNTCAMYNYGCMLTRKVGIHINIEEGIKYLKMAIDRGKASAIYKYGYMLFLGDGVPVDKEEAIKYFQMAIEKGNANAMNNYGYILEHGEGIPVNKKEAIKYYNMAIEKGNASAMNNYALLLERGDGVPININEAVKYYKLAIDKGNEYAMFNYAYMIEHGDGVPINMEEAIKYYRMSADKGNADAIKRLEKLGIL